jgi:hypothetical protein
VSSYACRSPGLCLGDQTAAEADCHCVRAASGLELGEQVANVGLDRLLREEEALADLAVDETVGDELEHLDLAHGRLLLELARRRLERDHLGALVAPVPARGYLVEATRVVQVPAKDVLALGRIHAQVRSARF